MIKSVVKYYVKQKNVQDFIENYKNLVNAMREQEGCLKYEVYQDFQIKNVITVIAEWESMQALEKHLETEHYKEMENTSKVWLERMPDINIYTNIL